MHDLKKFFLVKVVCICLKYQNPNRQPDHSTFTIYHNMLTVCWLFKLFSTLGRSGSVMTIHFEFSASSILWRTEDRWSGCWLREAAGGASGAGGGGCRAGTGEERGLGGPECCQGLSMLIGLELLGLGYPQFSGIVQSSSRS